MVHKVRDFARRDVAKLIDSDSIRVVFLFSSLFMSVQSVLVWFDLKLSTKV